MTNINWLKTQDVDFNENDKDFAPIKYSKQFKLFIEKHDGDENLNMDNFVKQNTQKMETDNDKANQLEKENAQLKEDEKEEGHLVEDMLKDYLADLDKDSKVFQVTENKKTIIAVTNEAPDDKLECLRNAGVEVLVLPKDKNGKVDLFALINELGERKIDSVLLEGGGTLNFSALQAGIVDRAVMFVAPKIVGGKNAKTPVEGEGVEIMSDAIELNHIETQLIENDLMITGLINKKEA